MEWECLTCGQAPVPSFTGRSKLSALQGRCAWCVERVVAGGASQRTVSLESQPQAWGKGRHCTVQQTWSMSLPCCVPHVGVGTPSSLFMPVSLSTKTWTVIIHLLVLPGDLACPGPWRKTQHAQGVAVVPHMSSHARGWATREMMA